MPNLVPSTWLRITVKLKHCPVHTGNRVVGLLLADVQLQFAELDVTKWTWSKFTKKTGRTFFYAIWHILRIFWWRTVYQFTNWKWTKLSAFARPGLFHEARTVRVHGSNHAPWTWPGFLHKHNHYSLRDKPIGCVTFSSPRLCQR